MKTELIEKLLEIALKESTSETKNRENTLINQGQLRICILQRGWVFIGNFFKVNEDCWLENAKCIRNWGTTKGLGELAENGPTSSTKLDPCSVVRFHYLGVIATLDCDKEVWKNK